MDIPHRPKAATLKEVALLAGVSRSAVSRTFTAGASVSKATRAKVLDACKQLGYRPNIIARTLVTRRSRIIAIVVSYLENQFYPLFIQIASQLLQNHGYHVLLFVGDVEGKGDQDVDALVLELMQYQAEGIILASVPLSSELAHECFSAGIPVVLFNRVVPVPPGVFSVSSDNMEGGRLAARFLLDRGYRRPAYLAGIEDSSTNRDRETGFLDELARSGVALFRRAAGNYSAEGAASAARELFEHPEKPDSVFVANDHMAFAAMDCLRLELGLRVPEDVGVVGFDNVPQAAWGGYRLTTIEQDIHEMTAATVKVLLGNLSGSRNDNPRQIVTPVRLIERATTMQQRN